MVLGSTGKRDGKQDQHWAVTLTLVLVWCACKGTLLSQAAWPARAGPHGGLRKPQATNATTAAHLKSMARVLLGLDMNAFGRCAGTAVTWVS